MDQFPIFPIESAGLTLADGSTWGIAAGDEKALGIVSCLAEAMQLRPLVAPAYQLLVLTDGNDASVNPIHVDHGRQASVPWTFLPPQEGNTFTLIWSPARGNDMLASQLMQLSLIIAQQAQTRGGFLLHGALIERPGWGIVLAGPGGVGKTTASRRFPVPWRPLSDDEVLIVRDEKGAYKAHPWPTWSSFTAGGKGGTWDVEHDVPLKAIFFLLQAQENHIDPMGTGHAVSFLVELSEQISRTMSHGLGKDKVRSVRLQRFENICDLAKSVPCYRLYLGLDGAFWEKIEQVIIKEAKEAL